MEDQEKEGAFDPECVSEIQDKLSGHSFALRAFGELLYSSDLAGFADQRLHDMGKDPDFETANLRWGLKQIVELYLEKQERILDEYAEKYHNSDFAGIKRAESLLMMVGQGAFVSETMAQEKLIEVLERLNTVIARGGELQVKAEELRKTCLRYMGKGGK